MWANNVYSSGGYLATCYSEYLYHPHPPSLSLISCEVSVDIQHHYSSFSRLPSQILACSVCNLRSSPDQMGSWPTEKCQAHHPLPSPTSVHAPWWGSRVLHRDRWVCGVIQSTPPLLFCVGSFLQQFLIGWCVSDHSRCGFWLVVMYKSFLP